MQILVLTLKRWVWTTSLSVVLCVLPLQLHANSAKPAPVPLTKSDQTASAKSEQAAPAKPAQATAPRQGNTAPKLSLGEDNTIRIPAGATDGEVQVIIKAENLTDADVAEAKDPVLQDRGGPGALSSTKVEFRNPIAIDAGTATRAWLLFARISRFPVNSSQKRFARFSFGKIEQYIEYTVTNLTPAAFTWSVSVPEAPWLVWQGCSDSQLSTTFIVTVGDYPASNLRLAQSTLRDAVGTSQIALEDLELCDSAAGPSGHFNIDARTIRTFYVRLKDKKWQSIWQNGKYTGTLSFAVNERPELQTVKVTLQASSFVVKVLGALLIAMGIIAAFVTGVWARAYLLRLEAERPVAVLREAVEMLKGMLGTEPKDVKKDTSTETLQALNRIWDDLTIEKLDKGGYLPPKWPPLKGGTDTSANLKDYLDKKGQLVDCLTVVICDGMRERWSSWEKNPYDDGIKGVIKKALVALDGVGGKVGGEIMNRTDAVQKVKEVVAQYEVERRRLEGVTDALADSSKIKVEEPTVQQVSWQIAQLSWLLWSAWGILTLIVGVAWLIVTNPGFGTSLDLVFCFLWGFGLPTTLDQLQKLGPGGIATSMGLPLPSGPGK
jgi:hypothetical protein